MDKKFDIRVLEDIVHAPIINKITIGINKEIIIGIFWVDPKT